MEYKVICFREWVNMEKVLNELAVGGWRVITMSDGQIILGREIVKG